MIVCTIPIFVCVLTFFGVKLFRAWSLRSGLLDLPNARSSHEKPTPRGGGLVFVISILASYLAISFLYPAIFSWGYLCGAALIAVVSLLDDIYSVSSLWRILTHCLAAILIIADKGYLQGIAIPGIGPPIGSDWFGICITLIWIVWLINAYNFMDGIDGIAGLQAVITSIAWSSIGLLTESPGLVVFGLSICLSNISFLFFNWHPASIFMGDVGSAFLGFTFAAIPLIVGKDGTPKLLPAAFFFVYFFVFDSVVTFIRRAVRGEKVWNAHREHLYQRLVQSGLSHAHVTLIYGVLAFLLVVITLIAIRFDGIGYRFAFLTAGIFSVFLIVLCRVRRVLS